MTAAALETLSEQRCFGGVQGVYRHASAATGGPMRFSVFLPDWPDLPDLPDRLDIPNRRGATPAVYFLAGLECTEQTFVTKAGAQRVAASLGLVLVTCDTSPRSARYPGDDASWDFGLGAGFYLDATEAPWKATYRMDTYVTRELPALVEEHFPIAPGVRGIFGHSMGGHGALALALRNPDLYRSVSAFAPVVAPSKVPWGQKAFAGYLGQDRRVWSTYDACDLVRARPLSIPILVGYRRGGQVPRPGAQAGAVRGRLRGGRPAARAPPPRGLRPQLLLHLHLRGRPPRAPRACAHPEIAEIAA